MDEATRCHSAGSYHDKVCDPTASQRAELDIPQLKRDAGGMGWDSGPELVGRCVLGPEPTGDVAGVASLQQLVTASSRLRDYAALPAVEWQRPLA